MWQVAVAAAVAGSGLLAKHLFSASDSHNPSLSKIEKESHAHHFATEETLTPSPPSSVTRLPCADPAGGTSENAGGQRDQSIFQFSSADSGGCRPPSRFRSNNPRASVKVFRESKARTGRGLNNGNVEQGKRGVARGGRKRVPTVRRVSLFFKKRKIGNNCPGKRDFSCSADSPSFGWGLGMGIMYMMSAGKEEIGKLSCAVDETAKVVHDLKAELYRRRRSHEKESSSGCMQVMEQENNVLGPSDTKAFSLPGAEGCEGSSSILTEELLPDDTEMDRLETEFESELQKLPSVINQSSYDPRITQDCSENRAFHESDCRSSVFSQPHGVSPAVLSEKLTDVLIKQQEHYISDLESELKSAYSKLEQKGAELEALKDCVKRLTNFSLSTASDEEAQVCQDQSLIIQ